MLNITFGAFQENDMSFTHSTFTMRTSLKVLHKNPGKQVILNEKTHYNGQISVLQCKAWGVAEYPHSLSIIYTSTGFQISSGEESRGDGDGKHPVWFDKVHEVNKTPDNFLYRRCVIEDMDIANRRARRSSSSCPHGICLWPIAEDGYVYVPYNFSSDFSPYDRIVITASMLEIEEDTCIRFRKRTSETDYINFVSNRGCSAALGKKGGAQTLSLERPNCIWSGVAIHELLHALGLHHEHVRDDRDKYVTVYWDRIVPGAKRNFYKTDTYNQDLTVYDYHSIMHYSNTAFSINNKPTLVASSNSSMYFGDQFVMTDLDKIKVNTLYKCKPKAQAKVLKPPRSRVKTEPNPITLTTASNTTTPTTSTTKQTTTTTTKPTTTKPTTTTTTRQPTTTTTTKRTTTRPPATIANEKPDDGCGGNLTASTGIITSPNFPGNYPNNVYCRWNITTNAKFRITFTDMDIEGPSYNCVFDRLRIYNGRDYTDDICGENLPSPITSYQTAMQIIFITDSLATRKGFRLVYHPV
ncbi:astacin-like metalloendopeptidase [Engystomops pustulosus]|uniref:astacin-like metalloendopeptidase n=1 Tax=Engystomops pustulosus TaxID=76066 RepID=UPI003AFA4897